MYPCIYEMIKQAQRNARSEYRNIIEQTVKYNEGGECKNSNKKTHSRRGAQRT